MPFRVADVASRGHSGLWLIIVASIARLLTPIGASEHLTDFLAHVLADTRHYDLRAVVIPDVKALHEHTISAAGRRAAARLLQHCLTELRAATRLPRTRLQAKPGRRIYSVLVVRAAGHGGREFTACFTF